MAPQKINIKEHVTEGEIDLSMLDLQDVPVKDIAVFKKAYSLDLSNNHLRVLPANFATLNHLTKLDLSKNQLTGLPENFGDLIRLKSLDLYQNKLESLPVSFHKLKALKWLDLKDNPLSPAVARIAGSCLDAKQCQDCARDVVSFYTKVEQQLANDIETKLKQKQLEANQLKMDKKVKKKENKKQKKENGPVKENNPKPANNKKNKKQQQQEKRAEKPSSVCKTLFLLVLFILAALFVLTSVKFEQTRIVEEAFVHWYYRGVEALSPNLKVYALQLGSCVKNLHDKTGNVTLEVVHYVQNKDNFVRAYDTLCNYTEIVVEKVKEQYKKVVS